MIQKRLSLADQTKIDCDTKYISNYERQNLDALFDDRSFQSSPAAVIAAFRHPV